MHNKLFIADNAMGITGGRNLGDAYFGTDDKSNFVDLDVLAVGPHRAGHVRQLRPLLERRAGLSGAVAGLGEDLEDAAQGRTRLRAAIRRSAAAQPADQRARADRHLQRSCPA